MRYAMIGLLLLSCTRHDDSKDKEIAALKAQLAAAPSASSVPAPQGTAAPSEPPAKKSDEDTALAELKTNVIGDELGRLLDVAYPNIKTIKYEHLKKNADRYKGKEWCLAGRILEISEQNGETLARVSIDDYGNYPVMIAAEFDTEFVEGNRVEIAGFLAGNASYTSQAGWNITIPRLLARSIQKPGTFGKLRPKMRHRASDED